MIRRIVDFVFILVFLWFCMLLGLWVINTLIVPLSLPLGPLLEGVLKVVISVSLVLLWLWIWRETAKKIFWRALRQR